MPYIVPISEKISQNFGDKSLQYIAALIASISTFTTGNVLAWTAQISPALLDGELGFAISSDQLGWIGSLMPLGAAFLSIFSGSLSEIFGRKLFMIYLVIPMLTGWFLLMFAKNIAMLYMGRFITGMIAGAYCVLSPLYSNEISQKEIRGILGCFTQMMISIGILSVALVSKYVSIKNFTIFCSSIPIIFAILFFFMPESPVYLLKKQRESEAKEALIKLRGRTYDIDKEIETIKLSFQTKEKGKLKELVESLKKKSTKRAFYITLILMSTRVLCGIDAVTSYASYIFIGSGVAIDPQTSTIILAGIQTLSGIFQSSIADRLGRKVLLLSSAVLMGLCMYTLGLSLLVKDRNLIEPSQFHYLSYIPVVSLCIYVTGYSMGLGPIPWMITGEIFPQEIKSLAVGCSNFVSWILSFIVLKLFLVMKDGWGQDVTFLILGLFTTVGGCLIYFFTHETKGKSFEQIQDELNK